MDRKGDYNQWRVNQNSQESRSSSNGDSNESTNCPDEVNSGQINQDQSNRSTPNRRNNLDGNQGAVPGNDFSIYVKRIEIMGQSSAQSLNDSTNNGSSPNSVQNPNTNVNNNTSNNQSGKKSTNQDGSTLGVIVRNLKRRAKDQQGSVQAPTSQPLSQPHPQPQLQSQSQLQPQPQRFQQQTQPQPQSQPQSQPHLQIQLQPLPQSQNPQQLHFQIQLQPQSHLQSQSQSQLQPTFQQQPQRQSQPQFQQQPRPAHQHQYLPQPLPQLIPPYAHQARSQPQTQSQSLSAFYPRQPRPPQNLILSHPHTPPLTPPTQPQEPQISPERLAMLEWQYQRQLDSLDIQRQHRIAQMAAQYQQQYQQQQRLQLQQLLQQHQPSSPAPQSSVVNSSTGYPPQRMPQQTHYADSSPQPKRRPPANQFLGQNNHSDRFRSPEVPGRPNNSISTPPLRLALNHQQQQVVNQLQSRRPSSPIDSLTPINVPMTLPMVMQRPVPRFLDTPQPIVRYQLQQQNRQQSQQQNATQQPVQIPQQPIIIGSVPNQRQEEQRQALINQHQQLLAALGQLGQQVNNSNSQSRNSNHSSGQSRGNSRANSNSHNVRITADEINKLIDDPAELAMAGQLYRQYSAPIERRNNDQPLDLSRNGQPIEPSSPIRMVVMPQNQSSPNHDGQQGDDQVRGGEAVNLSNSSQDSHIVDLSLNSSSSDKSIRLNGGATNGLINEHSNGLANGTAGSNSSNTPIDETINDLNADPPTDQLMIVEDADTASSSISNPTSPSSSPSKMIS